MQEFRKFLVENCPEGKSISALTDGDIISMIHHYGGSEHNQRCLHFQFLRARQVWRKSNSNLTKVSVLW